MSRKIIIRIFRVWQGSHETTAVLIQLLNRKEKHVADLTLVELANNYDEVSAILRIHYDAIGNPHDDGREMNSYAYKKAKDNYVQTFVRTKIAEEENNYKDFAQYVTYCVEH